MTSEILCSKKQLDLVKGKDTEVHTLTSGYFTSRYCK